MKHGSLFSGIGGFDLAAEWMGWENVFHCEWNPFGQKVLKHHFPNSISYNDITKTDFSIHRGNIDIITGGFPCQPYSTAGLRKGKADERHLFPEMLRAIKEIQPTWVIGENVRGLVSWGGGVVFHEVCSDLEREGYEVQPFLIPAAAKDAPHKRERIWFIAYSKLHKDRYSNNGGSKQEEGDLRRGKESNVFDSLYSDGIATNTQGIRSSVGKLGESEKRQQIQTRSNIDRFNDLENVTNTNGIGSSWGNSETIGEVRQEKQFEAQYSSKGWQGFPTTPCIRGGDDGLSHELDSISVSKWCKESIKGYGNAIVPQVAHEIFKTIEKFENSL
jgi:DNA (cytosine-5)-methyltransferase 1